ncbi:diguanylate cyclase [Azospirillum sp. TSO22-1]|uniref:GGDEF domain-containing response regulator n=1 Tax=Azospirillum sp. TSO22-1 TaxID=716789 RepID=UPI000D61F6B7|nr:diguanylate cyclase [Azospirillum sp. TSO22-1]PWC43588.1 transcriptional regulator [Azospirillum sp. TSO22-1]
MRILVVDDSRMARTALCQQLEGFGHQTAFADSGAEALVRTRDEDFDVVLVDFRVGDMEGVEVCWHLRAAQGAKHLYLMLMIPGSITNQFFEVVENGADEFLRKPLDWAWLRARLLAASRVVDMQRQLERLATTDSLTGALNRGRFMGRAADEVMRAQRYARPLSAIMLDIDHFKKVNDTHGHATGDEAIRSVVRVCRSLVRGADILGRLGGEEFAILLPETPPQGAVLLAERLRRALAVTEVRIPGGVGVTFTVSVGVSALKPGEESVSALLARADEALYRAKNGGRNRVVCDETVEV